MTGEKSGQAGWPDSSKGKPQGKTAEAGFTSSSGGVRALSVNAKKGLSDEVRCRNRAKSSKVAQESFGLE